MRVIFLLQKSLALVLAGYLPFVLYRFLRVVRAILKKPVSLLTKKPQPLPVEDPAANQQTLMRLSELQKGRWGKTSDFAIIMHLFYPEIFWEMVELPFFREEKPDFYFSIPVTMPAAEVEKIIARYPRAQFFVTENKGRDVYPFLKIFPQVYPLRYGWVCKVHTKKSPNQIDGDEWRRDLYESLFSPSRGTFLQMAGSNSSFWAPKHSLLNLKLFMGGNQPGLQKLSHLFNVPEVYEYSFAAGTMFWFRPEVLKQLTQLPAETYEELFSREDVIDGTMAHAFERFFTRLADQSGSRVRELHY